MAEQKESSVLFSLKELMSIEENRIREEEDAKKARADAEVQARAEAERRARDEEERRLKDEDERRRQEELRRKMEEAQIEAAKSAEIEKRKLEEQHRLQMEALAKQQAHEKEIHVIQSQKRKGIHPGILGAIGVALLGAIIAVIYFTAIVPKNQAKEAIVKADKYAQADNDESSWDEADKQLAIARANDPTNPDIQKLTTKVTEKREKLAAQKKKEADDYQATQAAIIKDLQDQIAKGGTPEEMAALKKKLEDAANAPKKPAFTGGGNTGAKPTVAKPCVCPPGVPLCSC